MVMDEAVTEVDLVPFAELMVHTGGRLVFARGVGKLAAIAFKLVHNVGVPRAAGRVNGENICQNTSAYAGGYCRLAGEAWHWSIGLVQQAIDNSLLVIAGELAIVQAEDVGVGQQWVCSLCVIQQALESGKQKGLVPVNGEAYAGAELLTTEIVLLVHAQTVRVC